MRERISEAGALPRSNRMSMICRSRRLNFSCASCEASRFIGKTLILHRSLLRPIDDYDIEPASLLIQLQSKLLLQGGKEARRVPASCPAPFVGGGGGGRPASAKFCT